MGVVPNQRGYIDWFGRQVENAQGEVASALSVLIDEMKHNRSDIDNQTGLMDTGVIADANHSVAPLEMLKRNGY